MRTKVTGDANKSPTTSRVPGHEDHFLINPFGLIYREVKASNLVKIDLNGNIVEPSDDRVNPAGFVVHSAIHRARPTCMQLRIPTLRPVKR